MANRNVVKEADAIEEKCGRDFGIEQAVGVGDVEGAFALGLEHQPLPLSARDDSATNQNGESQQRGEHLGASRRRVETCDAADDQETVAEEKERAAPGSVVQPLKRDGKSDWINHGQIRANNQTGIDQETAGPFLLARKEN